MGNVIYKMCRATKWHYPFAPAKLDMCLSTLGSLQICSVCIYRILVKICRTLKCWQISEVINYDCRSEAANLSKCMVSASQHASITVRVMVEKVAVLPIMIQVHYLFIYIALCAWATYSRKMSSNCERCKTLLC